VVVGRRERPPGGSVRIVSQSPSGGERGVHSRRLGDDGNKKLFRRLLEEALQELIDADLTAQIGGDRYQRSRRPGNERWLLNGSTTPGARLEPGPR
jgi:hypothetical protein